MGLTRSDPRSHSSHRSFWPHPASWLVTNTPATRAPQSRYHLSQTQEKPGSSELHECTGQCRLQPVLTTIKGSGTRWSGHRDETDVLKAAKCGWLSNQRAQEIGSTVPARRSVSYIRHRSLGVLINQLDRSRGQLTQIGKETRIARRDGLNTANVGHPTSNDPKHCC